MSRQKSGLSEKPLNDESKINRNRRRCKSQAPKYADWLIDALGALRPPERMTVSEWADRYRILDSKTSAEPGPWKTARTPYLAGIMDAFTDPAVEEIWFCKPTQVGGTETLNNMLGYTIAQDPSPTLIVYPIDKLAEYVSKNRLEPMIDLCPALKAAYNIRDSKDLELQFTGMYLVLGGANSPSSLASYPIRVLLLDEVDKYPATAGKEADPIKLARERTKTFRYNKKIVGCSTPTYKHGNIWKAIQSANELRKFFVPCPHCGHYQVFEFKQIKWPEGANSDDARDLAYYECEDCAGRITDSHKPTMLRTGEWWVVQTNGSGRSSVGFHLNTLYSPWVSFGDVAKEFLDSKHDQKSLQNFVNSWLAEPWEDAQVRLSSDLVMNRQSIYEENVVPDDAVVLTAGVDVQQDCMYWTVRAWAPMLTSWNIAHSQAMDWADIEQIMNRPWKKRNGEELLVALCAVDSGDQTEEVYDFCAMNTDWAVPVKGASSSMLSRYRITTIDKVGSRAYGMRLVMVNTPDYKSMIASRMNRANGKGSWMVYAGCDREYAEQVTSEHKVRVSSGGRDIEKWEKKSTSGANHYFDAEVYAACAADLMQVRYLAETESDNSTTANTAPTNDQGDQTQRKDGSDKSWIEQKGKWI